MKRLIVLLVAFAAALLLPAAAGAAGLQPLHQRIATGAADRSPLALARGYAPARYTPLAHTLSGTGTIDLTVYRFDGTPEVGAEADWWVDEAGDLGTGTGTTDAAGQVTMTGVPAATSDNGEIAVFPATADKTMYDLWSMSWSATGWGPGGLQPGRVPVTITRSSDSYWNVWGAARVRLTSLLGSGTETHLALTDIVRTGAVTTGYAPTITTGSETLDSGTVYFWDDEGMELPVNGIAVSSGATAGTSLDIREAQAHAIWADFWGSGKPGTKTWLCLNRFPAGWTNLIGGRADWPATSPYKGLGSKTSAGGKYEWKSVTIPSTVKPGYRYYLYADHSSGPLSLTTWFQTCTLNASSTSIRRGTRIKLSGVVPVKGHAGSTPGITSKRAIIYKTTKSTGQPTTWTPKSSIWTKVATVRVNGLGKFSRYVSPSRTTRYVVRYPGDAWYFSGFTSLRTVTVR